MQTAREDPQAAQAGCPLDPSNKQTTFQKSGYQWRHTTRSGRRKGSPHSRPFPMPAFRRRGTSQSALRDHPSGSSFYTDLDSRMGMKRIQPQNDLTSQAGPPPLTSRCCSPKPWRKEIVLTNSADIRKQLHALRRELGESRCQRRENRGNKNRVRRPALHKSDIPRSSPLRLHPGSRSSPNFLVESRTFTVASLRVKAAKVDAFCKLCQLCKS